MFEVPVAGPTIVEAASNAAERQGFESNIN